MTIERERLGEVLEYARSHFQAGQREHAELLYRFILRYTTPPNIPYMRVPHAEACRFFALEALSRKRYGTATDWYREGINADHYNLDMRVELCRDCLIPMGLMRDAKIETERALRIAPDHAPAWRIMGAIEHDLGNVKASIAAYDKQIALLPNDPSALLDRSTIALDVEDYDLVKKMMEVVITTERKGAGYSCLAMVAYREGRHQDAIDLYTKSIVEGVNDKDMVKFNRSFPRHSIGKYRKGWIDHECRGKQRLSAATAVPLRRFVLPVWNHEPEPARIHIHEEQGFGDTLAMGRFVKIMLDSGYEVSVEVRAELMDLFSCSFPKAKIVQRAADYPGAIGIPLFDYHIPMLSFPYIFQTDIDTIPWDGPYLKADAMLVAEYAAKLRQAFILLGSGKLVGLCWSSGIRDGIWIKEYGKRKSMHFAELAPFLPVGNCDYVSLQVGPERVQSHGVGGRVLDVLPEKPTWADTAALIANLDLVITVDSAVAHLAGAMGKPVWVMMHTEGSWHFMAYKEGAPWEKASPWYPSVRLYRQRTVHDWSEVTQRIADDLNRGPI